MENNGIRPNVADDKMAIIRPLIFLIGEVSVNKCAKIIKKPSGFPDGLTHLDNLLVVPFFRLKVCLWMQTCRTGLRSSFASIYITAVSALPLN